MGANCTLKMSSSQLFIFEIFTRCVLLQYVNIFYSVEYSELPLRCWRVNRRYFFPQHRKRTNVQAGKSNLALRCGFATLRAERKYWKTLFSCADPLFAIYSCVRTFLRLVNLERVMKQEKSRPYYSHFLGRGRKKDIIVCFEQSTALLELIII